MRHLGARARVDAGDRGEERAVMTVTRGCSPGDSPGLDQQSARPIQKSNGPKLNEAIFGNCGNHLPKITSFSLHFNAKNICNLLS